MHKLFQHASNSKSNNSVFRCGIIHFRLGIFLNLVKRRVNSRAFYPGTVIASEEVATNTYQQEERTMAPVTRISFERILCPMDLSEGSSETLRYGVALAKAYNAKLLACNCADASVLADESYRRHIEKLLDESIREHIRIPYSSALTWEAIVIEGDPERGGSKPT
jgi:hypothetical protein